MVVAEARPFRYFVFVWPWRDNCNHSSSFRLAIGRVDSAVEEYY